MHHAVELVFGENFIEQFLIGHRAFDEDRGWMNGLPMAFVKIVEDNDFVLAVVGHFFGRNAPDVTSSANKKYFPISHRTSRTLWSRSRTASYDLVSRRLWMRGRLSAE